MDEWMRAGIKVDFKVSTTEGLQLTGMIASTWLVDRTLTPHFYPHIYFILSFKAKGNRKNCIQLVEKGSWILR